MKKFTQKSKVIPIDECSTIKMVAGNENRFDTIVQNGIRKHWVGFGWVNERPANARDLKTLPHVPGFVKTKKTK